MPAILKVVIFVVVFFAVLLLIGYVGPRNRDFGLLLTLVLFAWGGGGVLFLIRGVYRFVTR
jgi:hypothetical protein